MQKRKLLGRIKKFNHNHVLAFIFLAFIFYVSTATLPSTITNIGNFLKNEKTDIKSDILAVSKKIDSEYRNMLVFKGNYLKNKGAYINLNGLVARIIGQRYMNDRIKLDNGHLTSITPKQDITLASTQLTKLYRLQKDNGKDFLFVLAPFQVPKYENIMPTGYIDYANQNADNLLEVLLENNIPFLDLREEMLKDRIDHSDAFFVTDHHWKPETAFWAYTKILQHFTNNKIIEPINPMYSDIQNYDIDIKKNWFLGSAGKRTGSYYAGVDDFAIISPKFNTTMNLSIPSLSVEKNGNFREVAFSGAENVLDYFSANPNGGYGYGRCAIKSYYNKNAPSDIKIMSIGDSFAPPSVAFLSLAVTSCDELDMNQYQDNFMEYYLDYEPDVMIVFVTVGGVVSLNTTFDFLGDLQG